MASVENLVAELKALTPDQLVHELSVESRAGGPPLPYIVSNSVLEQAIQNGWPASLFRDLIGHIDEDLTRPSQFPYEVRRVL